MKIYTVQVLSYVINVPYFKFIYILMKLIQYQSYNISSIM